MKDHNKELKQCNHDLYSSKIGLTAIKRNPMAMEFGQEIPDTKLQKHDLLATF